MYTCSICSVHKHHVDIKCELSMQQCRSTCYLVVMYIWSQSSYMQQSSYSTCNTGLTWRVNWVVVLNEWYQLHMPTTHAVLMN